MFTGLVERLAPMRCLEREGSAARLVIAEPAMARKSKIGDSIAINGCCLTVVAIDGADLTFEAGPETLSRTNLGALRTSDLVNLESSLAFGDKLGGHLVTGHIDGVGTLAETVDDGPWRTMWFRVPRSLTRQMASKGSVAVDGVSLTLVDVEDERFSVALIPHTLSVTTLGRRRLGDQVNIETDLLAKYVERQLATGAFRVP
jgi:riboflavin synthase